MNAIIAEIQKQINDNQVVNLNLVSSASRVPKSYLGGNEALAAARLKNGESALIEALAAAKIDMNKISTTNRKSLVSGPIFSSSNGQTEEIFSDFQYFKVILN
jgi:CTP synthase (UTP-ammonia lyase)